MSRQNRSIKDFFRPATSQKLPAGAANNSSDNYIALGGVEPSKRRRIWSSPHRRERHGTASIRAAVSRSPTPTPSTEHPKPTSTNIRTLSSSSVESDAIIVVDTRPATASSSFTSLPRSSQTTSSKRVVENGEEVVKGSDSDTDGSDSSLEDLSTILSKQRKQTSKRQDSPGFTTTMAPRAPDNNKMSLQNRHRIHHQKTPYVSRKAPEKNYNFSLDTLVQDSRKTSAIEARIAEVRSKLQQGEDTAHQAQGDENGPKDAVVASLVESGDADDEGKARRVMEALERTEALERNEVWHFFDQSTAHIPKHGFPNVTTNNVALTTILNDPARRQQAFLTGFLSNLAFHTKLPEELVLWLLDEVCTQSREDLVQSYISVLEALIPQNPQILSSDRLVSMFKRLGVKPGAADLHSAIVSSREAISAAKLLPSASLRHVAKLLGEVAHSLLPKTRELAIHLLIRSAFDDGVLVDGLLRVIIEDALVSLITAIPEPDVEEIMFDTSKTFYDAVQSAVLRQKLISSLPCRTPRCHLFRRRLALAFALNSSRHLKTAMDKHALTAHVLVSLAKSPAYNISPRTDYAALGATINMLDIAIDAGFSDFAFLQSSGSTSGESTDEKSIKSEDKEDLREKEFNTGIDMLAREIREIMARVVDTGASHMRRTEAKATAERLVQRLECSVRTKPKMAKDWFDAGKEDKERKEFMERWVAKGKQRADPKTPETNGI